MKTIWKKWILPLFFGILLFLCIRVGNDVPRHENYWEIHNMDFIWKEIVVVLVISYPLIIFMRQWFKFCIHRNMRWIVEFGAVVVSLPLWCLIAMWLIRFIIGIPLDFYEVPFPAIITALLGCFFYTQMRSQYIEHENEAQRLQLEKVKNDQLHTELKFLKAQYHPHFLFNVLNTVYFQIDEQNEEPRRTIEQLSELLRYQLYQDGEKVPLATEVHHLEQYIAICRTRANSRLKLTARLNVEDDGELKIYPLLFIPLVENAFKYVGGDYRIEISLSVHNGVLLFYVSNSIPQGEPLVQKRQGIGLENLRRRLKLLYGGRFMLRTDKKETVFDVWLTIKT